MDCCHYLTLVYGIFVKKKYVLEKYRAEFEKYKRENNYDDCDDCDDDFLRDYEKVYKDVANKVFRNR